MAGPDPATSPPGQLGGDDGGGTPSLERDAQDADFRGTV